MLTEEGRRARAEYLREYRRKNAERLREQRRERYQRDKERIKAAQDEHWNRKGAAAKQTEDNNE